MYKIFSMLALILGVMLAPLAYAESIIVGISPNGNPQAKKIEVIEVLKFVTEITDLGETSIFVNALTGESICDFHVKAKKSYSSAKAKINYNRVCVGGLMTFAKNANPQGHSGATDFWVTLRTIAGNYNMERTDAIILIGDPRYHSDSEAALSMMGAHVANDSHIVADSTRSHYGMAGLEGALNGTPVHFSSQGYDWFDNTRHKDAVTRFQSLSVEYLGGQLVTANQDTAQLFERIKMGLKKPVKRYEPNYIDKLEMLFVGREVSDEVPIHEREISTETINTASITRSRNIQVGITWRCACDLDVFVQANRRSEVLFYGNQSSAEGIFRKDYRSASALLNGLETVRFHAPVDLSKMMIGVNHYSGRSSGDVTGEIRITIGSQTYAHPFVLKSQKGNKGVDAKKAFKTYKAPSNYWMMISAQDILKPYMN